MAANLIGSSQVAARLGCSKPTVHRLVSSGALTPATTGPGGPHGAFLFNEEDVEAYIAQAKKPAAASTAAAS